ncbi:MAG: 2Fe-2S iron-sulfur cluster binding domain-containing protein [Gemmataceae bacterium]|nr:2Fe-2S iron-sulfur cluster binding domain-containing protein [Gemmataceae bacterium]
MAGVNPYIAASTRRPRTKYSITFLPMNVTVEVDPKRTRYGHNGLELSVLDVAEGAGVEIDHACGGVCACSTCHVIVREGGESCGEADDAELDQLDNAPGLDLQSRLACQCVPDGSKDVVVEVPGWNRNLVREGH